MLHQDWGMVVTSDKRETCGSGRRPGLCAGRRSAFPNECAAPLLAAPSPGGVASYERSTALHRGDRVRVVVLKGIEEALKNDGLDEIPGAVDSLVGWSATRDVRTPR